MRYAEQTQNALDRLDVALAQLRTIVKNGQITEAIHFMEEGELKERFNDLQSMITLSQTNPLGSRGTSQTGTY
tara:strand:+ start:238 stop:456 length:219 start_codon:yes stop_codon:yes gene_type:complete